MIALRRYIPPAILFALFGVFLIWPIARVVHVAFFGFDQSNFTFAYVYAIFADSSLRAAMLNSALIAVCVTLFCIAISMPLALLSVRCEFPAKQLANILILVPLILPPFVGAIGMRQILGRFGMLTSLLQTLHVIESGASIDWIGRARIFGIILVESLSLYPIIYLNLAAALSNIDPTLEQAAANLGASRWNVFWRITFPLTRPGLLAGGAIVLIWSFTELGTPLMFEFYQSLPVQLYHQLTQVVSNPLPYALVVVMLVGSGALYFAVKFFVGSSQGSTTKTGGATALRRLSRAESFLAIFAFGVVIALALLPHVGVILMSVSGLGSWYYSVFPKHFTLEHFRNGLMHPIALPSILNSIRFALMSASIDLVLGVAIAILIVRTEIIGKNLLDLLAMLPLAVPGIVLAFGYLAISTQLQQRFASIPWLRDLVDVTENPTLLLVIAYAMRRLPYVVRSAAAGLEQVPVDLEGAARNLGASALRALRRVTIPLISANLIAGGLLAFAFAMLEVSDSLILAQKVQYWPITKAIYELTFRLGDGPYIAAALGVWAMLLMIITIFLASDLLGRRIGAIFRV